jgi:ribulose kinase
MADSEMKGMISGLTMDVSQNGLAVLYLAALQSLAYSTRYILETLVKSGYEPFEEIVLCGGLSQGTLFCQIHADVLGVRVLVPGADSEEKNAAFSPVLLGAAMLGASASGTYPSLASSVKGMAPVAKLFVPDLSTSSYHDAKYRVFRRMGDDQLAYRQLMAAEANDSKQ